MIDRGALIAKYMAIVINCEGVSFARESMNPLVRDLKVNGDEWHELRMIEHEAEVIQAGCRCARVLLGHKPGVGPRCRLCNTQAENDGMDQLPLMR